MGRKSKRSQAAKASAMKRKSNLMKMDLEFINEELSQNYSKSSHDESINSAASANLNISINNLTKRIENLEAENFNLKGEIKNMKGELNDLKVEVKDLNAYTEELDDYIYDLEVDLTKLQQYGRKENLTIQGIPNSVGPKDLEKYVVDFIRGIGVDFQHYDIAACHRLYQPKKHLVPDTIIRFINRKKVFQIHKNKYKLSDKPQTKNIKILENLCPKYKKLYSECLKYIKEGTINSAWFYNTKLHVCFRKNEDPIVIYHTDELKGFIDELNREEPSLVIDV